jgi:diacylglycerol kinase (ATP)
MSDSISPRQVLVAVNLKAGDGRKAARVEALRHHLVSRDCPTTVIENLSEVIERANAEFAAGRLHALVGAGGDGTLNALLNGATPGLPLAMFPCGTENLLARYLQLPREVDEAAAFIARGRRQAFDVGRVGERLFLLTLSVGFDAAVIHHLHANRRGNIGHSSYLQHIARAWCEYEFPELRVTVSNSDVGSFEIPVSSAEFFCRWCFVQNLPAYAMRLNFTPEARGDDGLLDFCLFEHGGAWSMVRHLWNTARGRHLDLADTRAGRAARLRIETIDANYSRPVPVQVDGDPAGVLPITVETLPNRAVLIVP